MLSNKNNNKSVAPPRNTCIVTCLNSKLYKEYGHKTLASFPKTIQKYIWSEDTIDGLDTLELTDLSFYNRNKDKPFNSYKHDAVRFHWKVNAIYNTLQHTTWFGYDALVWIDADTLFLQDIDESWIKANISTTGIMSYLGRPNYYSECSLLYFNLRHPDTEQYITDVWNLYVTDCVYELKEQHDSYLWDEIRKSYEFSPKWAQFRDLGAGIDKVAGGHISSHLYGQYFDHMKGKRKTKGSSPENKYNKQ